MALVIKDRVKETTASTGTGTITLDGADTGFQAFSVIGDGNTTYYTIADQSGPNWEVGIGTYTASGTTLSRDTVLASSNSGSLVNFGAGPKDVFVTYPGGKAVYYDASSSIDVTGSILVQAAATQDAIKVQGRAGGTSSYEVTLTPATLSADRVLTLPDATTTAVGTDAAQTLTNKTFGDTPVETIYALTDASTVDIDPANGSIQTLTLTSTGRTLTFTNMVNGEAVTLMVNDGTAGTITTWNATFVNNGGVAPTLSTTGYTVVVVWKVSGTVYAAVVGNA